MTPLETARLIKILSLTTSNHDGEALAAIRKANQIMRDLGVGWPDAFPRKEETRKSQKSVDDPETIFDLGHAYFDRMSESQKNFFRGLRNYWDEHGRLSERQLFFLMKLVVEASKGAAKQRRA